MCICVYVVYICESYLSILNPGFQILSEKICICVKNNLKKNLMQNEKYLCKSSTIKSNTVLIIRSAVGEARSHN